MLRIGLSLLLLVVACSAQSQQWTRVGIGTNGPVHSFASYGEDLSVGGAFTAMNGFERINHCMIRENSGLNYTYFGTYSENFNSTSTSGVIDTRILCATRFNNRLHIGGKFTHPDYPNYVSIGYFEPSALGDSTYFGAYNIQLSDSEMVNTMIVHDGQLFFGGDFTQLNGASYVGRITSDDYPEPTIQAAGSTMNGAIHSLEVFDGQLYAAGEIHHLDTDSVHHYFIAVWNGSDWDTLTGKLDGPVLALKSFDGRLIAAGAFQHIDSLPAGRIAAWDGASWDTLASGFTDSTDTVFCLAAYSDTLYAGGRLKQSDNIAVRNLARFDGDHWFPLFNGVGGKVYALQPYRGRLYIGGNFQEANSIVSRNIIAYNNGAESVGIDDVLEHETTFHLFPNPADHMIQWELPTSPSAVRLIDMHGHEVQADWTPTGLNTTDLPNGTYVVHLQTSDQQNFHQTFVVLHR